MKKFIAVSLILLMIIFAGCGQNANMGELPTLDFEKFKELGIDNNMCVEMKMLFFEDYGEYDTYIKEQTAEGKVPSKFYSYERLKSFGSYDYFVFLENEPYQYERYFYNFFGASDIRFDVYVYHRANGNENIAVKRYNENELPQNTTDMRVFNTNISKEGLLKYIYNNIEYSYYNGNLYDVTFYAGDTYVAVSAQEYYKYPLNSGTFQSKLLNLETAEQAIKDIFGEIQPIEEFYATAPANVNETADVDNIEDTICR